MFPLFPLFPLFPILSMFPLFQFFPLFPLFPPFSIFPLFPVFARFGTLAARSITLISAPTIRTKRTMRISLAEMPDAILDVIDSGFQTKIALGLQGLGYLSVARRDWKLKDTPIPCLDTVLLESPSFCDIDARFLLGTNDVPHPDPQQCLFIWARRGVSAGKGFNNGFFRATHFGNFQQDSLSISMRAKGVSYH